MGLYQNLKLEEGKSEYKNIVCSNRENLSRKKANGAKAREARAWRQTTNTNGFIPFETAAFENKAIPAYTNWTKTIAMYAL